MGIGGRKEITLEMDHPDLRSRWLQNVVEATNKEGVCIVTINTVVVSYHFLRNSSLLNHILKR